MYRITRTVIPYIGRYLESQTPDTGQHRVNHWINYRSFQEIYYQSGNFDVQEYAKPAVYRFPQIGRDTVSEMAFVC